MTSTPIHLSQSFSKTSPSSSTLWSGSSKTMNWRKMKMETSLKTKLFEGCTTSSFATKSIDPRHLIQLNRIPLRQALDLTRAKIISRRPPKSPVATFSLHAIATGSPMMLMSLSLNRIAIHWSTELSCQIIPRVETWFLRYPCTWKNSVFQDISFLRQRSKLCSISLLQW